MRRGAGFTLLELLVSLAIFALISAMAYGGLQSVMDQQQHTDLQSERLADLQLAYRLMQRDLEQITARKIRNEFGDTVDALVGGSGFSGVEFSRGGHPNPAGFLRSEIQRVAYVPDQDTLIRRTWRALDRAQDSEPDEQVMVEELSRFEMRFLDDKKEWQDHWPPLQGLGEAEAGLPEAVEVRLELDDVGTLVWLFRLPESVKQGSEPGSNNRQDEDNRENEDNDDQ